MMKKKKEKFFIFLDIDGTLWDRRPRELALTFMHDEFNPESVKAVLYLMDELKKEDYDPKIVIISKQRADWENCLDTMHYNGFPEDIDFIKLPIGKYTRGERISLFLNDYYIGKDITKGERKFGFMDRFSLGFASKCFNYVVIDDDRSALTNIPFEQHIMPDIDYRCLDLPMVKEWLTEFKNEAPEQEA